MLLERDYNSVYTTGGEVQLLRKRWTTQIASTWEDADWAEKQTPWDATFSLADGVHNQVAWNAPELFEVAVPSRPLAAPKTSISDRLGVVPLDVVAPDMSLPDLEPGEVLPPAEEETVQVPAEAEVVDMQATGWTGGGLAALEPLGSEGTNASPQLAWGSGAVSSASQMTEA